MELANKHKYLPIKSYRNQDTDESKPKGFQNLLKAISTICKMNGQWSGLKINEEILSYKQTNTISILQFDMLNECLFKIASQNEVLNVEIRVDLLRIIKNLTESEIKATKNINFETRKMIEHIQTCYNKVKEGKFINSDVFIDELQKLLHLFQSLDKVSQKKLQVIPTSFRMKTLPQKTVVRKKQYFNEKQSFRQTFFSKRYSSSQLEFKIRSKILSKKKIEESPQRQTSDLIQKSRQSKLFPSLHYAQSPNCKKKYLFNFYHRSKQQALKHPLKLTYRLE